MYATDGDFGRVRLTSHVFPLAMQEAAACLSAAGWHRVNDRYGISRPAGGGEYLLLITVDGEGFLRLDEETHPLLPGGVAIVPPGCPHAYGVPPGGVWEFYWLHPAGGAAVRLLEYIQARRPAGRPSSRRWIPPPMSGRSRKSSACRRRSQAGLNWGPPSARRRCFIGCCGMPPGRGRRAGAG